MYSSAPPLFINRSILMIRLFGKINVLAAVCQPAAEAEFRLYPLVPVRGKGYRMETPLPEAFTETVPGLSKLPKLPTLLVITGYGVLEKSLPDDTGVAERVLADSLHFVCKERGPSMLFIRREQVDALTVVLTRNGIELCDLELFREVSPDVLSGYAERFLRENLKLTTLFLPQKKNSILAAHLYKRFRYYILGGFLVLLLVNFFVHKDLSETASRQTLQRTSLEKQSGRQNQVSKEKQKVLTAFMDNLPWKYSMLCDYLAAQVSAEIVLQRMAVQPLTKQVTSGTPPAILPERILISGSASDALEITRFIALLEKEPYAGKVHLRQMAQEKATGTFSFNLEVVL